MLERRHARRHQQHVQQRPAVVGIVAGMRHAGQGGRERGLVVGPRGLEQGPRLGCFRLGIVAVWRLAIAVPAGSFRATGGGGAGTGTALSARGTWTWTRRGGVRARNGPGRHSYRSNGQQAGDGPSNRFSQHVFALQETVEPGACGPDQASCSGRVGLRPDLGDFGLRAPRAKRNSSACPGCRLAASRRMRPCASRAIAYPRASVLPGSSARSCGAGGGQPVARLQAQPRVGLAQLPRGVRHAFCRAARVGLAMFQALREQGDARCARLAARTRRTPAGSPGCSGARADVPGAAPATPAGRRRGRGAGRPAPAAAAGRAPACAPRP